MDALQWAEKSRPYPMYPSQRFLLKVANGIALSDTDRVEYRNPLTRRARSFTEKDYLRYLYDEGRSNILQVAQDAPLFALAAGRRGGKSTLMAPMLTYGACQVLQHRGLGSFMVAGFTMDADHAQYVRQEVQNDFAHHPEMVRCLKSMMRTSFNFEGGKAISPCMSGADFAAAPSTRVRLSVRSQSTKNLCGQRIQRLIFDEMAFYPNDNVYHASIAQLAGADLGVGQPKIVCLSSPNEKSGVFYDLFDEERDFNAVLLRIPTWELNPSLTDDFYRTQLNQLGTARFMNEYGAEFLDAS
jgi:hypothetical protein